MWWWGQHGVVRVQEPLLVREGEHAAAALGKEVGLPLVAPDVPAEEAAVVEIGLAGGGCIGCLCVCMVVVGMGDWYNAVIGGG